MTASKLTSNEAHSYWRRVHVEAGSDLQAVCFPHKSRFFNVFFHRIQTAAVRRALDQLEIGGSDTRVLEVGCGRGRWLRFFAARGASATGVDLSPDAVARCVEQGLTAVRGSAERLPFPSESFDLVVSVTVLLHLLPDDQHRAVAEMQRVCRTGGNVLILEGSGRDPSPHVWARPAKEWIALFGGCVPVLSESHYFAFPLRLLWRAPLGRVPSGIQAALEHASLLLAWPLELALMRLYQRRTAPGALQTLIVLRKSAEGVGVRDEPLKWH
jgi:SAM-dependent methyltransferase